MGGPGRIQLHLFTPVGHRLVAPGGREGAGRRGRGLGEWQGLLRPGGLFVATFPAGAPARAPAGAPTGLRLVGPVVPGWFFSLLISLFFFLDLLLLLLRILTHVFPLLGLPVVTLALPALALLTLVLVLGRLMGRGRALGRL